MEMEEDAEFELSVEENSNCGRPLRVVVEPLIEWKGTPTQQTMMVLYFLPETIPNENQADFEPKTRKPVEGAVSHLPVGAFEGLLAGNKEEVSVAWNGALIENSPAFTFPAIMADNSGG